MRYFIILFISLNCFSQVLLPQYISEIGIIKGITKLERKNKQSCKFTLARNFGLNNQEQIDLLVNLQFYRYKVKDDCNASFILPYDINALPFNIEKLYDENSEFKFSNSFHYIVLYHLSFLSLLQDEYSTKVLLFHSSKIIEPMSNFNQRAYSAERSEIYGTDVLTTIFSHYKKLGLMLNSLSNEKLEKLAEKYLYSLGCYPMCESRNKDFVKKELDILNRKQNMQKFINIADTVYTKKCKNYTTVN
jgi:hypothetical protein